MPSSLAKSAALVELVLAVADRCRQLVESGLDAGVVEHADFSPVIRAREQAGPADAAGVRGHRDTMLAALDKLGAST